jgi:hypothetical protein
VLVQYLPHAYGFKAMNLPFCLWLNLLGQARLTVMFHEVAFPFDCAQALRHNVLGFVTRVMAQVVCRNAARIMVASERWQSMLRRLGARAPISWVPIPSTIPVVQDAPATGGWRQRCVRENGLLVGHFANYSAYSVDRLSKAIPALLEKQSCASVLLLGAHSGKLRERLLDTSQHLAGRIQASGVLSARDLSAALRSCDVMVQPYPDGVSTRRSSTSALLAHGCAIITTRGIATERLWHDSGAVITVPADSHDRLQQALSQMLSDHEMRRRHQRAARALYYDCFALHHTIAALSAVQ